LVVSVVGCWWDPGSSAVIAMIWFPVFTLDPRQYRHGNIKRGTRPREFTNKSMSGISIFYGISITSQIGNLLIIYVLEPLVCYTG
jgi:hypothetical protein